MIGEASTRKAEASVARFDLIDGLRAIAAIVVLVHHASLPSNRQRFGHFSHQFTQMDIGVAMFFAISGFVLYRPFALRLLRGDEPEPSVLRFLLRRAVRIFPAYWFALTTIIAVGKLTDGRLLGLAVYPNSKAGYLPYYLLIHTYRNTTEAVGGINQAWTLAVEVTFYLFLPCFAFGLRSLANRCGASAAQRYRMQCLALLIIAAGSIAFRSYTYWGSDAHISAIGEYWLPANLDLFAIGMFLAVVSAGTDVGVEPKRTLRFVRAAASSWWVIAIVVFWFASNLVNAGIYPRPDHWRGLLKQEFHGLVAFLLMLPAIFPPVRPTLVSKLLRWKPIVFCGLVSYGIYLWHQAWIGQAFRWQKATIVKATGVALPDLWFGASMPLLIVFGLTVSTAVAAASWFGLERPIVRLLDRKRTQ